MKNFSYVCNLPVHQHADLDFVDVRMGRDNKLFIDPARIHLAALSGDPWAKKADLFINSFFNTLYEAASRRDFKTVHDLTDGTCGEINETQLGMSQGIPQGNGASYPLIFAAIKQMIDDGFFEENLIKNLADVAILADGIDADRLSDWTTNIIRPVLQEFTVEQYKKYGLREEENSDEKNFCWDIESSSWRRGSAHNIYCKGRIILLCPKKFIHKKLLMSTGDFLRTQVLTYRQKVHLDMQSGLCRQQKYKDGRDALREPRKKDIIAAEIFGNSCTQYVRDNTKENPELLSDYHRKHEYRPGRENYFISDKELDEILYKN